MISLTDKILAIIKRDVDKTKDQGISLNRKIGISFSNIGRKMVRRGTNSL